LIGVAKLSCCYFSSIATWHVNKNIRVPSQTKQGTFKPKNPPLRDPDLVFGWGYL
jgi:hypothetical protein